MKATDSNRLVLGTAQLGMDYGIANKNGQPDQQQATAIIRTAWESGIREFDTAQGYGESEKVLGKALQSLGIGKKARVITKLSFGEKRNFDEVTQQAVTKSLERVGVEKFYGIMLHEETLLDEWDNGLGDALHKTIEDGQNEQVGISVYSPDKALQAIATAGISIIQIPANLLDRRFENAGIFDEAQDAGKLIYVRSVYLQGLLLMASWELSENMRYASPVLNRVDMLVKQMGISRQQLVLGFIKVAYPEAKVVVGAETPKQIKETVALWGSKLSGSCVKKIKAAFVDVGEDILNPVNWPKQ